MIRENDTWFIVFSYLMAFSGSSPLLFDVLCDDCIIRIVIQEQIFLQIFQLMSRAARCLRMLGKFSSLIFKIVSVYFFLHCKTPCSNNL